MNFTINTLQHNLFFFREKAMTLQSEIYSGMIKRPTLDFATDRKFYATGKVCSKMKYVRFYLEKAYSTNFCNNKVSNAHSISNSNIFLI